MGKGARSTSEISICGLRRTLPLPIAGTLLPSARLTKTGVLKGEIAENNCVVLVIWPVDAESIGHGFNDELKLLSYLIEHLQQMAVRHIDGLV